MTRVRVNLRVPVGRPLPELAAFVARCEDAGLDGVGIHDHPSSGRDVYLALALAAQATRRLRLFPATSSPVVRHPLVLASLAHSLDEIAPGRAMLTVAPGFISTRSMGKPRASVAVMRQAIGELRRLLAGDRWSSARRHAPPEPERHAHARLPAGRRPAHDGAGRGDRRRGVSHGRARSRRRSAPRAAIWRRARGAPAARSPGFPVVFVVTLGLGDAAVGARWVRSWFAPGQPFLAYPSASNLRWLAEAGFELREPFDPAAIAEERARRIADAFGLFGPPERCAERLLRAREEAGVEEVFLFPAHDLAGGYEMPQAEVEAFERVIRPRLGA